VPVETGVDPSVVILTSTETEHKSTEPTIDPAAQLSPDDYSQSITLQFRNTLFQHRPSVNDNYLQIESAYSGDQTFRFCIIV
jgi:hypothetical protein